MILRFLILVLVSVHPVLAYLWPVDPLPQKELLPVWHHRYEENCEVVIDNVDLNMNGFDDVLIKYNQTQNKPSFLLFYDTSNGKNPQRVGNYIHKPGIFGKAWYCDLEKDGKTDLFVGFNDSLSLSLLHFKDMKLVAEHTLFERPNTVSQIDGWKGDMLVVGDPIDLNGDGKLDILIHCFAGYSLYPRGLMGFSPSTGEKLWYFPTGGNIGDGLNLFTIEEDTLIVFGTNAPGNGNRAGDYDDIHAYVFCLNLKGELVWKHIFFKGNSSITIIKWNDSNTSDVFVELNYYPKIVKRQIYLYQLSLYDGSIIRERKISENLKPVIHPNIVKFEKAFPFYKEEKIVFLNHDFNITKEYILENLIRSVNPIGGNYHPDAPMYYIEFIGMKPRLFEPEFNTFIEIPAENRGSQYNLLQAGPPKYSFITKQNNDDGFIKGYRYSDGPSLLQFYGLWGLLTIPGLAFIIITVSIYLAFIIYRRLAFVTSLSNTIMKYTGKAFAVLNKDGMVEAANSELKILTGIEQKGNSKYHYQEYFAAKWTIVSSAIDTSFQDNQKQHSLDFDYYDGSQNRHLNLEIIPLRTWFGISKGKILSISDLTEHDRAVELDSVRTSVGILSHNVKNLMQSILYGLKIYRLSISGSSNYSSAELESLLDRSLKAGDKIYELSRNLTVMSNIKVDQKEWTNAEIFLKGLLQELIELYEDRIKIEPFQIDGSWLLINRKMFKEVIRIIVDNGIHASINTESIDIYIYASNSHADERMVNISIRDKGEGIHPESLKKIFEPGKSNKNSGTGLGLFFSQQIIRQHEGMITAKSETGKGTELTVSLPIYAEPIGEN